MEYLQDLGRLALGSRLRRLSNELFKTANALYKNMGIELDSTCFPLLNIIHEHEGVTLREAQIHLGTSHADISQKASKLQKLALVNAAPNPNDQRSRVLTLTQAGEDLIKKTRPLWQAIDRSLAKLLFPHEEAFFENLQIIERSVKDGTLISGYENESNAAPKTHEIIDYKPKYKGDFQRLNREWLKKYFRVEQVDQEMFDDPEGIIIKTGGFILFSKYGQNITGTCALYKQGNSFELCKMGVDPRFRGLGIASALIEESLKKAKNASAQSVYLLSHTKLKSALHVYQKHGFKDVALTPADKEKYNRADIRMEYKL